MCQTKNLMICSRPMEDACWWKLNKMVVCSWKGLGFKFKFKEGVFSPQSGSTMPGTLHDVAYGVEQAAVVRIDDPSGDSRTIRQCY